MSPSQAAAAAPAHWVWLLPALLELPAVTVCQLPPPKGTEFADTGSWGESSGTKRPGWLLAGQWERK